MQDFATEVLSRAANEAAVTARNTAYDPLLYAVPPTSNTRERLFSQWKLILTPQRTRLLPVKLEMIAFLKVNRSYWDVNLVADLCVQESVQED